MIPAGSNPAHGDIPEPAPKAPKQQKEGVSDAPFLQSQQAYQKARLKNDHQRADAPTKQVKGKVIVYDMKLFFKSCVTKYLELTKSNVSTLSKQAPPLIFPMMTRVMMNQQNHKDSLNPSLPR